MQWREGRWKSVAMAFIPAATELLPTVVSDAELSKKDEKQKIDIQQNSNHMTNLAITKCSGETQANLASVITQYVETLNQHNLRFLGKFLVF